MATVPQQRRTREIDYPTSDGKPMAETELHLNDQIDVIQTLKDYFEREPMVYVGGNMLVFYEEGNRRKHLAPDVFVVRGVEKKKNVRDYYLIWKEGKSPELVIEVTSKTTKNEDKKRKWALYRDVLGVTEYILFDPTEDYLKPSLQGFRLVAGEYLPIELVAGRLPSQVLGLHLERDGRELRFFDPATGSRLPTKVERTEQAEQLAEAERLPRRGGTPPRRRGTPRAEAERLRRRGTPAQLGRGIRPAAARRGERTTPPGDRGPASKFKVRVSGEPSSRVVDHRSIGMATTPRPRQERTIEYPTGDGNPMIETELHRKNLGDLLEILSDRFADDPMVYVAADLVIYYEEGIPDETARPTDLSSCAVSRNIIGTATRSGKKGRVPIWSSI